MAYFGKRSNEIKEALSERIEAALREAAARKKDNVLSKQKIDVTLPGRRVRYGRLHPVTQVRQEVCAIFSGLGFSVAEGPEVELEYYNFEALNIPAHHPARDLWDTFYLSENLLLRTHTSPVQIHFMEKKKPPFRLIVPGRCYRSCLR